MSDLLISELDVTNFRSIRGHVHVPLDAKVVLVHGENGVGKTSLLSAIELGLTGGVQSLRRADTDYARQLLHRSAIDGKVTVKTTGPAGEQRYEAHLDETGAHSVMALEQELAAFFGERTYLPQSLLGQLLQIYQDSGSGVDSPLARFVGDLLGLDRLDALEAGLKPLADVRNVRKVVDGWSHAEAELKLLNKLLDDRRQASADLREEFETEIEKLSGVCADLGLSVEVGEQTLEQLATDLLQDMDKDEATLNRLTDQRRRLGSIRRELAPPGSDGVTREVVSATAAEEARSAYAAWEGAHGERIATLRKQIETLLPVASLPTDHAEFVDEALTLLRTEHKLFAARGEQARMDLKRLSKARGELSVAQRRRETMDEESSRMTTRAGGLSSVLSELSLYVDGDVCPVCDRPFSELEGGSLADHLHGKVRRLSASAERLLALGRSRSEQQVVVETLEGEIEALQARVLDAKALAAIDRQAAALDHGVMELGELGTTLAQGSRLRARDVAARRAVREAPGAAAGRKRCPDHNQERLGAASGTRFDNCRLRAKSAADQSGTAACASAAQTRKHGPEGGRYATLCHHPARIQR